jgi:hypothetical protein
MFIFWTLALLLHWIFADELTIKCIDQHHLRPWRECCNETDSQSAWMSHTNPYNALGCVGCFAMNSHGWALLSHLLTMDWIWINRSLHPNEKFHPSTVSGWFLEQDHWYLNQIHTWRQPQNTSKANLCGHQGSHGVRTNKYLPQGLNCTLWAYVKWRVWSLWSLWSCKI